MFTSSALVLLDDGVGYRAVYIIKWNKSGKCSVTDQRPKRNDYKTMWIGNQPEVARRKVREFITIYKCR